MTLFEHTGSSDNSDSFPTLPDPEDPSLNEGSLDDLASTPQPPPEALDEKTKLRFAFYRETAAQARKFYETDRTLDREDRANLVKAYRTEMFSQYGGAIAGLALGLVAPKHICKFIGRTYKPSYSTLTGVVTVILGYNVAARVAHDYNLQKMQGNERYLTVLKSTGNFPPVIGYSYFQETLRRPDSTLPDPSKIDWSRYPAFPLILTTFNWYRNDIKGISESAAPIAYQRGRMSGDAPTAQVPHTDFGSSSNSSNSVSSSETTKINPSGFDFDSDSEAQKSHSEPTTWEKIREQNKDKKFKWQPQQLQPPHQDSLDRNRQTDDRWQDQDTDIFKDPYQSNEK